MRTDQQPTARAATSEGRVRIVGDCRLTDSRLMLTDEQASWFLAGTPHTCTDATPCDARALSYTEWPADPAGEL